MLVIFDWDGTLANSTGKIVRCLSKASVEIGLPVLSDQEYAQIIGLALPLAIETLYPEQGERGVEQMVAAYSRLYVADKEATAFFDDVVDGLHGLKKQGFKLAVATGKSRKGLTRVLKETALTTFFDASRCADEAESKPSPLMLEQILNELGYSPEQAMMVGDTSFDLNMAHNAGMKSIGVSYGAHSMQDLTDAKPLHIVDDFAACLDAIGEYFNVPLAVS